MKQYNHRFERYCKEYWNIENYELAMKDNFKGWICHHRLELNSDYHNSAEDMKLMNLYYNRPYNELIFLTIAEHNIIHKKDKEFNAIRVRNKLKYNKRTRRSCSVFGIKFESYYKCKKSSNKKLYNKEYSYYRRHNKCRWE